MAEGDIDNVHKYLQLLPEFDGDPYVLPRFIDLCDKLFEKHVSPDDEFVNSFVVSGILNKLCGVAGQCVRINGANDWKDIKNILLDKFADHRDEAALCAELCLITQGHRTTQVFYEQIKKIYSTIMSLVMIHDKLPTTIEAKRKLYENIMLQTFLCGLNEPLGSRIRCMRPKTIDIALQYALEEQDAMKLHQNIVQKNNAFFPQNYGSHSNFSNRNCMPQSTGFGSTAQSAGTVFGASSAGTSLSKGLLGGASSGFTFGAAAPPSAAYNAQSNKTFPEIKPNN